ncbi:MAG: P-II family nitrogen regulator [Syntrophorhabdales bacterium]|jgi:nitrogen regulatory protein P-II 1
MKKIEAIIEPSDVQAMKDGLTSIGIGAMTVTEVKDFGSRDGLTQVYRGVRYQPPFLIEAKIEVVVTDDEMDRAVAMIQETAKKDASGESKVFIFPLEQVRQTGKKSIAAVS